MKLIVSTQAAKQYRKLQAKDRKKIYQKLKFLEINPYVGKPLQGELDGLYALRAWPYRIIYLIDKSRKQVEVVTILHRQGAYG